MIDYSAGYIIHLETCKARTDGQRACDLRAEAFQGSRDNMRISLQNMRKTRQPRQLFYFNILQQMPICPKRTS